MKMAFLFIAAFILALSFIQVSASPQVQLGNTTIVGRDIPAFKQEFFGGQCIRSSWFEALRSETKYLIGIPYVEPPLGNLRLRPPVLRTSLGGGVFNASEFGLACLQPVSPILSVCLNFIDNHIPEPVHPLLLRGLLDN